MASFDLAEFTAATKQIVERQLDEATSILRETIVDAFQNIMDLSPRASYATEGYDRYRASNHMANGPAQDHDGAPKGQASYEDPDISIAQTIAEETDLGETVNYWNNVGYENSKKPKSYAYFIEYGWTTKKGVHHEGFLVYEKASEFTEIKLEHLVDAFNAKVIE